MAPKTDTVTDAMVKTAIKQGVNPGAFAKENGINGGTAANMFYRLEPVVDPSLVVKTTAKTLGKAAVRMRKEGIRWERIAARTDNTTKAVQEAWEAETGESYKDSYSGRGRRFEGMPQIPKSKAEKPAPKGKPAGKPASAKAKPNTVPKPKARTRAALAGKTKDPS